jgi:hypothetical protein
MAFNFENFQAQDTRLPDATAHKLLADAPMTEYRAALQMPQLPPGFPEKTLPTTPLMEDMRNYYEANNLFPPDKPWEKDWENDPRTLAWHYLSRHECLAGLTFGSDEEDIPKLEKASPGIVAKLDEILRHRRLTEGPPPGSACDPPTA